MEPSYPIDERMGPAVEESANTSASRQKNCNGCVQAKRRCDRRTPVCSRCAEKKALAFESPGCSLPIVPGLSFDLNYPENIPTGFQPAVAAEPVPQSNHNATPSSDIFMENLLRCIADDNLPSQDQWLVTAEGDYSSERPATPADEEVVMAYQKMDACAKLDTWHAYDPKTPLYYILNRVKEFTGELAAKNTTPFIHGYLYHNHKPQCMISCFTTCVLYASRTPTNMHMVMRAMSDSVREFVDTESSRVLLTPIEKLARSQTLFLYQIIRLFDGDVTLRAQGEKDIELLKTWLGELCRIRDNLGDLVRLEYASARRQPPVQWEKWVFAECVRRTILISYAVLNLYELLKDLGYMDPSGPWDIVHRWTIGRALWEASTPTEFQRAWYESSHFIIANFTLENFIENGKAEDVDEFAEIFLNVYMGVDGTKEFMASQKREVTA